MNTKICTKCGVEKPATVEWFSKQKTGRGGLRANCRVCLKVIGEKYYINNKDHLKENTKKYKENNEEYYKIYRKKYRENNKEYLLEYRNDNKEHLLELNRAWRKKNAKRLKEYNKRQRKIYLENNREKISKRRKEYQKKNLELFKTLTQKRRAIKRNLPSTLTPSQWQSTKDHFNHECAYCGKPLKNLAQEHVIPLSKGGGYTKGNIIPSCKICNSSKNASDMKTWYTTQTYFSIERYNKILAFIKEHKSVDDYTPIIKEGGNAKLLQLRRSISTAPQR